MGADGGTQMWCPNCLNIMVCKAINPSHLAGASGQRWARTDHTDVNWFRRGRMCLICYHEFMTAELDEQFVDELVQLRDALGTIKLHAEAYAKQSENAQDSLRNLTESLQVLRALSVYQNAE